MVNWTKISKFEAALIAKIAKRAQQYGNTDSLLSIEMDISAAHLECPMRLNELLDAKDFDFFHDVFGIRQHINRKTGKLEGCFVPRYAMK